MDQQYNPISRSMDVFRSLNSLAISSSEEFFNWQLDHTQALISRRSKQLKASWSEVKSNELQWPDAVQSSMRNAIELAQECVNTATDYQMETLRLVQKQATQAQKVITQSLAALNEGEPAETSAKAANRPQKLAS